MPSVRSMRIDEGVFLAFPGHGGNQGNAVGKALRRLVTSQKMQFRWRNPERNPYIFRDELRNTVTSRYHDVAMAMGQG